MLTTEEREEINRAAKKEKQRVAFLAWQRSKLNGIIAKFNELNSKSCLARNILQKFPEEKLAWQALANLYNNEATLFAAFDFFSLAAISAYLDSESTPEELVNLWLHESPR